MNKKLHKKLSAVSTKFTPIKAIAIITHSDKCALDEFADKLSLPQWPDESDDDYRTRLLQETNNYYKKNQDHK